MSDIRLELRAVVAIARKDLRILSRYPLEAFNVIFQPVYQFLIPSLLLGSAFLVAGRATGFEATAGTADVAGFLILGMVVAYLVGAGFWGIAFSFKREMDQATLEPAWLTPTARETFVVGRAVTALGIAGIGGVAVLLLAVTVLGARLSAEVLLAIPAVVLAAISIVGVSLLIASAVLLLKEPNFFVDASSFLFDALTGVAFPITVLPGVLKIVAFALPTTYALDILRTHGLGARPLLPIALDYAALTTLAVVLLVVGRAAFRWTDGRLREQGTVGQH